MKWWYKSIKKFFCLCFQNVLRLLLIAISAAVSLVQATYPLLGWISAIAIGSLFCPCPPSATAHIQIMSCLFKTYNGCPWHLEKKSKALLWFLSLYLIWPLIASLTSLFIISSDFFIHVSWGQKVIKLVSIIQRPGTTFVVKDSNIFTGNCFIVILSKSRDQIATGSSDQGLLLILRKTVLGGSFGDFRIADKGLLMSTFPPSCGLFGVPQAFQACSPLRTFCPWCLLFLEC